jgi:hypothetical protein
LERLGSWIQNLQVGIYSKFFGGKIFSPSRIVGCVGVVILYAKGFSSKFFGGKIFSPSRIVGCVGVVILYARGFSSNFFLVSDCIVFSRDGWCGVCVQCGMLCGVQCAEWKLIYFLSKFFGGGCVYNVAGCSVIPVGLWPYFGNKMQQSTKKWMWMVEDVTV